MLKHRIAAATRTGVVWKPPGNVCRIPLRFRLTAACTTPNDPQHTTSHHASLPRGEKR